MTERKLTHFNVAEIGLAAKAAPQGVWLAFDAEKIVLLCRDWLVLRRALAYYCDHAKQLPDGGSRAFAAWDSTEVTADD